MSDHLDEKQSAASSAGGEEEEEDAVISLSESQLLSLVKEGQNATPIWCQRCSSSILLMNTASYIRKEIFLPHMKKKSENQAPDDGEILADFWAVGNMYTFENVGFTNTIGGNIKYLICADCEVGPIGMYDVNDKTRLYVALDRVRYEDQ